MFGFIGIGVCVVFSFCLASCAYAANPYKFNELAYFERKKLQQEELTNHAEVFDFREPVLGSDGNMTYYTPPSAVLKLLQNPTYENAQAYMAWQKQKMLKINKAQQAIDLVVQKEVKD